MNGFSKIWKWWRALRRSNAVKHEIDEELRFHVEARTAENIAAGMPAEEAAREARRRFGNVQTVREVCREERGANLGEGMLHDICFGLRMLRKNPGFTATAVLTLALGIGASTAIYSFVNTVLLNPVPGKEPDRLIEIGERSHGNKDEPRFSGVTTHFIEAMKTKPEFFSDVVTMERLDLERKTDDFIDGISGKLVSPNFFAFWNIKPIIGRTFAQGEAVRVVSYDQLDRDAVVVLSYQFWQSRFGGSADVIGKTLEAKGTHYTVIGVMPAHFQFPDGAYATFWVAAENTNPEEQLGNLRIIARLKPGVSIAQTQSMLDGVAADLKQAYPKVYDNSWHRRGRGFGYLIRPLRDTMAQAPYGAQDLHRTLFGLLTAIGFVLLIGCVNVANLMLARTERRQQEFFIRAAVGATSGRLLRQVLTESGLLAAAGALAGLAVTGLGMRVLTLLIPDRIPRLREIHIDGTALGFTLLISIGTTLAFGLIPAWRANRASAGTALKGTGSNTTTSVGWRRYRSGLVVGEVALSLLLLTGAGLMIESVFRLLHTNPGFDAEKLVFANPGLLRAGKYAGGAGDSKSAENGLHETLRERFAALPGVTAVGVVKFQFAGLGFTPDGQDHPVALLPAGTGVGAGDVFQAMRVPLLAGRYLDNTDVGEKIGTVVINQTMADLCWPGENAINKRFHDKYGRGYEVVGVMGNARIDRLDEKVEPMFFRPYQEQAQSGGRGPFFVVRTEGDTRALLPVLRDVMKSVESSMTTPRFEVERERLYEATQAQRTYMLYLTLFAGVGLLLSALGIYGVLAYAVARRTREIGIRMALGAQQRQVLVMVMAEGGRLIAIGVAAGMVAAFWLMRLLRSQLFEVQPGDPLAFLGAALTLALVGLLACFLPARRATRIKPMEALRYE